MDVMKQQMKEERAQVKKLLGDILKATDKTKK